MNKERLRKLAQKLDKTAPEKFDMATWCGSSCCIAGHVYIMRRKQRPTGKDNWELSELWENEILPEAIDYLDLDDSVGSDLMQISGCNGFATPKQAAKVIRHLVKTGEVDWARFVK